MKNKIFKYVSRVVCCLVLLTFIDTNAQATLVKSLNIKQLSNLARYIVKATVIDQTTETDPYESGKIVDYYTVQVKEWIKGEMPGGDTLVFKQLADGVYDNNGVKVRQSLFFPKYEVGKTYLFFLPQAHHKTGLLAPIGLDQGVYVVQTDESGNETLPQLKSRARFLAKDLDKDNKTRFLSLGVSAAGSDNSYESFKRLVEDSLK